jgi:hypothetical protein
MPVQTLARSPREALDGKAGLLASGSSYSRSFPHGQPSLLEDPLVQWLFPVSYPVTVAGAAPVSHRLPSRRPSLPDGR